ncbi:MAG TPA: SDR family oxidoreductase [Anaeromyxobacteraceae bacterium]|nr:SDR family oxidoreductase [Anaeromyxobacteraceae bacterium]
MIAVTGATGHLGRIVIEKLLAKVPPREIVALVRDPAKAADLAAKGVKVRAADYAKPETLGPALAGVEKLLLISSSEVGKRAEQHLAVVKAAKKEGVRLIAYTSILRAGTSTLALATEHKATEDAIRASGLPYVFLRNGWYLENYTENLAPALQHGALAGAAKDGRIAAATRADYAEAAVAVLTGKGPVNHAYELAGDVPFTMAELAAEVSKHAGKKVVYADMPTEQYRAILVGAGLHEGYAEALADSDVGISRGELDDATGDLHRLIGRATTPLAVAVRAAFAK